MREGSIHPVLRLNSFGPPRLNETCGPPRSREFPVLNPKPLLAHLFYLRSLTESPEGPSWAV
jgi:hypothetical protein